MSLKGGDRLSPTWLRRGREKGAESLDSAEREAGGSPEMTWAKGLGK
jgi:hypothetical protein